MDGQPVMSFIEDYQQLITGLLAMGLTVISGLLATAWRAMNERYQDYRHNAHAALAEHKQRMEQVLLDHEGRLRNTASQTQFEDLSRQLSSLANEVCDAIRQNSTHNAEARLEIHQYISAMHNDLMSKINESHRDLKEELRRDFGALGNR